MKVALLLCGIASLAFAQVKDMRPVLAFESQEQVAAIKASGASVQRVEKGGAGRWGQRPYRRTNANETGG